MRKKLFSALLAALAAVFYFTSCNCPRLSKCTVTVMDSAGTKVLAGIRVQLYATVNGGKADLQGEGVTDKDGKVSFSFKNPCVMDVLATRSNCTVNPGLHAYCTGSGIVKCEEGKTAQKTIRIDH